MEEDDPNFDSSTQTMLNKLRWPLLFYQRQSNDKVWEDTLTQKTWLFSECANALRLSYTVARDGLVTNLEVLKGMITILLFQMILQEYPVQRPTIISLSSR